MKCRLGEWPEAATASEFSSVTVASTFRKASSSSSCPALIIGACIEASRPFGVRESKTSIFSCGMGVGGCRGMGGEAVGAPLKQGEGQPPGFELGLGISGSLVGRGL